mgnify:CR=1 FL=1
MSQQACPQRAGGGVHWVDAGPGPGRRLVPCRAGWRRTGLCRDRIYEQNSVKVRYTVLHVRCTALAQTQLPAVPAADSELESSATGSAQGVGNMASFTHTLHCVLNAQIWLSTTCAVVQQNSID